MTVKTFTVRDGRKVILRPPKREDLDDLLDFINSLVREEAPILLMSELSREEEKKWLDERLMSIKKGEVIYLVAEIEGKVVAGGEISKHKGRMSHVGTLGIAVKSGYRHLGIATKLVESLLQEAKKQGLKTIRLEVLKNNLPAIALYKKLGFKKTGEIPRSVFWRGRYVDLIIMALQIA